jgi:hypothetical protein
MRICRRCNQERDIDCFDKLPHGRRWVCSVCRNAAHKRSSLEVDRENHRRWRINRPHLAIMADCKKFDKKHGFCEFDLDSEFVLSLISTGCHYCGETKLRMTLDRIDNAAGHTRTNVLPCCLRCNYIRGSMPFDAWMELVPAIRKAKELGLFGTWRSTPFKK